MCTNVWDDPNYDPMDYEPDDPNAIDHAPYIVEFDEYSIEIEISGHAAFMIPGKYTGPPEDCYPDEWEPSEWEIDIVRIYQADGSSQEYDNKSPLGRYMLSMVENNDSLMAEFESQIEKDYG